MRFLKKSGFEKAEDYATIYEITYKLFLRNLYEKTKSTIILILQMLFRISVHVCVADMEP